MSVKLSRLVERLEELYPPRLAEEWDRVGLITGHPDSEIDKVLVAVDPVAKVLEQAIEVGAQLIVTHHPLYLRGTSFVAATDPKGSLIHQLIENGIALCNAHTNADSAKGGVADCLAAAVGLENTRPLLPLSEHTGTGRIGDLPAALPLKEYAQQVEQALPACPAGILVGGDLDAKVQRIAVSGGSGSEHLEAGKPYLICATHWASEWPWVPACARQLEHSFVGELTVEVSKICTDPWAARIAPKTLES